MTKEQIIEAAKLCGLSYHGDDEWGDPEFIGKDDAWDKFEKVDLTEVIEEPDFTGSTNEDR